MTDKLQGAYVQAWVWISEELLDPNLLDTTTREKRVQLDKHIIEVAREIYQADNEIEIDNYAEVTLSYD